MDSNICLEGLRVVTASLSVFSPCLTLFVMFELSIVVVNCFQLPHLYVVRVKCSACKLLVNSELKRPQENILISLFSSQDLSV